MRIPSPPPEEIWHGLATLYDNTFPTYKEYCEFTVNRLTMWGNTLDYKFFDTLYMTHQYHARTIKRLCEQAMALLEEANKINKRDMMVRHEIESHVRTISRSDLRQWIKKPQRVWVIVPPTPLSTTSWQSNNSHHATYGQNYARQQYQCFECGDPTHFEWDCPFYTCRTCKQMAPGHAPLACHGQIFNDGIRGHYNVKGFEDGNLPREC
jgi:ribosomal protein L37AE/L43A